MKTQRATFKVLVGPNAGDTLQIELGSCRLLGRHLSEHETAFMDRDGNRVLDATASDLLGQRMGQQHKKRGRGTDKGAVIPAARLDAYERGPDIILADDAISRAHAMLFYDETGVGIIDLASTNGTYVNGERIGGAMVHDGDVVALGATEVAVSWRER